MQQEVLIHQWIFWLPFFFHPESLAFQQQKKQVSFLFYMNQYDTITSSDRHGVSNCRTNPVFVQHLVILPPTKLSGVFWFHSFHPSVCPFVRPSVRPSVCRPNRVRPVSSTILAFDIVIINQPTSRSVSRVKILKIFQKMKFCHLFSFMT